MTITIIMRQSITRCTCSQQMLSNNATSYPWCLDIFVMKNVLKNDTFLDQTNNDLMMFRPIHINSSQLVCACQGTFKGPGNSILSCYVSLTLRHFDTKRDIKTEKTVKKHFQQTSCASVPEIYLHV